MKKIYLGIVLTIIVLLLVQCQNKTENKKSFQKEPQPIAEAPSEKNLKPINPECVLSGAYLKAFLVAYADFEKDSDIPQSKKMIENYQVEFKQDQEYYIIYFLAIRGPNERGLKGGESALGKDVQYSIDKSNFQLRLKQFYK